MEQLSESHQAYLFKALLEKGMQDEQRLKDVSDALEQKGNELEELDKKYSELLKQNKEHKTCLCFEDAHSVRPKHGDVCLCILKIPIGSAMTSEHLALLKYNDRAKYWDSKDADVYDGNHDDGVYDYADYKVEWFMTICSDDVFLMK